MKSVLQSAIALALLVTFPTPAEARDFVYQGTWYNTARKSQGTMTCVLSEAGRDRWRGRFYGTAQGLRFDYTVSFDGPPSDLYGDAMIEGILYDWNGSVDRDQFRGTFNGGRNRGHFDLRRR